ncbi:Glutamate-cysteine ligase family 2(GCS2) [Nitrosospira multiformis]|uniref:Glutamate-cysteine ligase family 2(GCS2) n=1 Tax=Nitrosospira multiformis TaxID=1231 RepID=A0A1H8G3G9_9PROT|nr:glutamate-cysteine ligase family protein [Nitrosospira multiformis]SEN38295.1 Glutamate-cysteine ligase family 2(GCS2) [Nitrosospira multiformis]
MTAVLPAFAGYGIELEYMIVDRKTLAVVPMADELLRKLTGAFTSEARNGQLGWSNELVLHLLELKNIDPQPDISSLSVAFQGEIRRISKVLESMNTRLMPTGMHPWMNPRTETRLWPHEQAEIYLAYDHIFDCRRHGWANLQSMHLNMPFANDNEFARLHAAVRLLLPILPAIAASSPIAEGGYSGFLDFRMVNYCEHQLKVPSTIGRVIPETISNAAAYEEKILAPMYREIAALDPKEMLQHEWLNARGEIPRFDRNAIEIRVIDTQECSSADFAIAAAAINIVHALYSEAYAPLTEQQSIATEALVRIMHDCIRDAEQAVIDNVEYLRLMGFPGMDCTAGILWRHLIEPGMPIEPRQGKSCREALQTILREGPLARRILNAIGSDFSRRRLETVYRELCDCLDEDRMFLK